MADLEAHRKSQGRAISILYVHLIDNWVSLYVFVLSYFVFFPYFRTSRRASGISLLLGQTAHLLGGSPQAVDIGALDHDGTVDGDLLAVLKEQEGGHGRDTVVLGNLLDAVDVDLGKGEEVGDGEGLCELGVHGRNGLARPAPVGVEVGDDVLGRVEESRKLLGRVDVLDAVRHCEDVYFVVYSVEEESIAK